MAIVSDLSTAKIEWKTQGASAASTVGTQYALIHCNKNVDRSAGDRSPAGDVALDSAIDILASVFVEATAGEAEMGDRQFGLVQVTGLFSYEFLYAGRVDSEGSCVMNMKSGFGANPSLDVRPNTGQSIDDRIFDFSRVQAKPTTAPRRGFNVTVDFGDQPNNSVPLIFRNLVAKADNFLARISRSQQFIVHFVTRENDKAPVVILGRLGWAVSWIVDYNWAVGAAKPVAEVRRSDLFPGQFVAGPASDNFAQIAVNRTTPTTNKQDTETVAAIFDQRKSPMLTQTTTRPDNLPSGFFK